MNADALRHFFGYHLSENRALWDKYVMSLTQEQFVQEFNYSHGSVRNQIVHLMSVDDAWFSDLRGVAVPDHLDPTQFADREVIRAHWDQVEERMRGYLDTLQDETLLTKPLQGEDEGLTVWQILLHVANHGTDHRAQMLRLLYDLGVKTLSQDYIFYVYDNPT